MFVIAFNLLIILLRVWHLLVDIIIKIKDTFNLACQYIFIYLLTKFIAQDAQNYTTDWRNYKQIVLLISKKKIFRQTNTRWFRNPWHKFKKKKCINVKRVCTLLHEFRFSDHIGIVVHLQL